MTERTDLAKALTDLNSCILGMMIAQGRNPMADSILDRHAATIEKAQKIALGLAPPPEEKALDQAHQDYRQELVDGLAELAAWFNKRGEPSSGLICTRAAIEIDGTSASSPLGTCGNAAKEKL